MLPGAKGINAAGNPSVSNGSVEPITARLTRGQIDRVRSGESARIPLGRQFRAREVRVVGNEHGPVVPGDLEAVSLAGGDNHADRQDVVVALSDAQIAQVEVGSLVFAVPLTATDGVSVERRV